MAYATQDRIGRRKVNPTYRKEGFLLGDGEEIFAHTLCGVRAADGKLVNLNGNEAAVSVILYADEHIGGTDHAGRPVMNDRTHAGGPNAATYEVVYHLDVYLDAVGLAPGDEGADAYLVDDHTVSTDDNAGARPYVGKIKKVISATYASVYIPGLERD